MSNNVSELKYCQKCIEENNPNPMPATREWQVGIYYCEEHFIGIINSLTSISPEKAKVAINTEFKSGAVLEFLYEFYQVPPELQFDSVDNVCRNYDKLFNFHAPAVINRTIESLDSEIEQLKMSIFNIKYRIEPLEMQIAKLKEKRREEKGLKDYSDNKETYAKGKAPTAKTNQDEKLAKAMNMTIEQYQEMKKKAREREFNKMAGNCLECGGAWPCVEHPNAKP